MIEVKSSQSKVPCWQNFQRFPNLEVNDNDPSDLVSLQRISFKRSRWIARFSPHNRDRALLCDPNNYQGSTWAVSLPRNQNLTIRTLRLWTSPPPGPPDQTGHRLLLLSRKWQGDDFDEGDDRHEDADVVEDGDVNDDDAEAGKMTRTITKDQAGRLLFQQKPHNQDIGDPHLDLDRHLLNKPNLRSKRIATNMMRTMYPGDNVEAWLPRVVAIRSASLSQSYHLVGGGHLASSAECIALSNASNYSNRSVLHVLRYRYYTSAKYKYVQKSSLHTLGRLTLRCVSKILR